MPINIEMLKDKRVVLQTYSDPISPADMDALKNRMNFDILANAPGIVHIIADFRQVSDVPRTILTSGSSMMSRAHPNTGVIFAVVERGFIKAMAQAFSRISRNSKFLVFGTMEEALAAVDKLLAGQSRDSKS